MVASAASLVAELAKRMGEFYSSAPTSAGTTTTLIDTNLDQYWPNNVGQQASPMGAWVYGKQTIASASANKGVERRARDYVQSSHTVTFLTAWPAVVNNTNGQEYEFHWRTPRSRKLEAINSGIRQLGFHWYRSLIDTSLLTVANQWTYTLPATVQWNTIPKIEIQIATDATLVGYPYVNANLWNWTIRPTTDATGATTYTLQFGSLPPPGRSIRLFGEVNYVDLVADADILPLDTSGAGIATEWLYSWAMYMLQRWESVRQPMNNTQWLEQQATALLKEASEIRDRFSSLPTATRIVTPNRGTGEWPGGMGDDPEYMSAYRTIH